jgi:hypothetical protein
MNNWIGFTILKRTNLLLVYQKSGATTASLDKYDLYKSRIALSIKQDGGLLFVKKLVYKKFQQI